VLSPARDIVYMICSTLYDFCGVNKREKMDSTGMRPEKKITNESAGLFFFDEKGAGIVYVFI
jgi:hypothetical protein